MSAVWAIALPDSEKLVMLALADWSDDAGYCWPSVAKLALKCSKSERTIQGALRSLESKGHLTRDQRPGHGCKYTVHPTPDPDMDGYSPTERHYVYRVEDRGTGEFYIGARSCYGEIEADDYMGSGVWAKAARESGIELTKQVVAVLPSRGALAAAEAKHVAAAISNPLCRNKKVSGVGALSRTGYRGDTPAAIAPRSDCAPQPLPVTPAAVAPNTSRHTISEKAKAFSVRDAFSAWNETAKKSGLPVAKDLTPQRAKHIAARLRVGGEATWREALAAVEASPLCTGDNERGWRADLDFVCQPKSFNRLIEGFYAAKTTTTGPPVTVDPARVAAMTADFKARQRAYLDELDAEDAAH